ncbi:MAG: glycosyltransferase [Oceanospirillaceae bacterium]|nr:glycosyltransferase [Oceanospirillaceae bacterium]
MADIYVVYPRIHEYHSRLIKIGESLCERDKRVVFISMKFNTTLPSKVTLENGNVIRRVGVASSNRSVHSINFVILYLTVILTKLTHFKSMLWLNSVSVLPLSVLWGKVIYAPHELETERSSAKGGLKKKMSKLLERTFIKFANHVIVVGNNIAKWYKEQYDLDKVYVVRNIPKGYSQSNVKVSSTYLRDKFNIDSDTPIFLYQGIINKGRGLESLIAAFSKSEKATLVVMGFGPLTGMVKEAADRCERIKYHDPVPPQELESISASADFGLCLIENICLSYYYSLPNKLFEYINSGIPVIGSNFPEIQEVIEGYNIGWCIAPDSSAIESLVAKLKQSDSEGFTDSFKRAKSEMTWSSDFERLDFIGK